MDNNLKKLQKKWYAKLKNSGFEDAEQNETQLKSWHSHKYLKHSTKFIYSDGNQKYIDVAKSMKAKQDYFILAEHFLNSHKFADELEKFIWLNHSEGLGIREIVAQLDKRKIKNAHERVFRTVKKLRKEMLLYGTNNSTETGFDRG